MQIVRRTLFESDVVAIGHVTARPSASPFGEVERQDANVVVLPLAGIFAKHDGPRRHVIATPNHAVLIAAGSPYRISLPADIGDQSLTLRFSGAELARLLPQAVSRDGFDSRAFASYGLLPPSTMLGRSLLWQRFVRGEWDPVEVEELGIGLLISVLHAVRKERRGRARGAARERAGGRLRRVECVKEAISLYPERKWTLGALADLASVSPCHLARMFRDEVGAPVYRYLLRARLAKALEIVLGADTELTAVALDTGFASHSHFTARFRALFGSTPTELRRRASSRTVAELRKNVTAGALAAV
jgi:AraC family transcriptional regulator